MRLNYDKIRKIQDKMLKGVETTKETWDKKQFMYCPVCGKRMECKKDANKKT